MRRTSFLHRGFTMVETALAVGVVAVVLVSLIGVMPVALTELSRSRDVVVVSELAEGEISRAAQMDFSKVGTLNGRRAWYDLTGVELKESEIADKACYQIKVQTDLAVPGMATVKIAVYRHPRGETAPPLDKFRSLLADNGR